MTDAPQTPKLYNPPDTIALLREQQRDTQLSINCVQIGVIREFDAATQLATVQIALKQVQVVAPDGTKTLTDYPLLLKCPVVVLFGGVSFLSFPIAAGDSCVILFNDREIDNWLNAGAGQAPTTSRVHDLSDGIALVGIRSLTNSIATYLENGIRLSHGGTSRIDLKDNLIDSLATLFLHTGNMQITGDLTIDGDMYGNGGGAVSIRSDVVQETGKTLAAGNGASGTFDVVTVVNGIVVSGS